MTLSIETRTRIESLLSTNRVVLFMKGTRGAPQCGFSAASVEKLDDLLNDYTTVNVLADEEIRSGIKEFGNWPTIPQLYVDGELVGGCDIIQGMYDSGELHGLLGAAEPDRTPPDITISDAAADAIRSALANADDEKIFLGINAQFQPQFQLRPATGREIVASANGLDVHFDVASAQRARGARIDWVEGVHGTGLSIDLPQAPKPVRSLDVKSLKQRIDAGDITVLDVRPAADRARAPFSSAQVLDAATHDQIAKLPKDSPLAFLCHHGNSSRSAAEHFREHGFTDVWNVEGGIDAWSREIDPGVPQY